MHYKRYCTLNRISNIDCVKVKGFYVLEINSSDHLVCRYYDNNGFEEDDPLVITLVDLGTNLDEAGIIRAIKNLVGTNKILISDSAIKYIQNFVK